MNTENPNRKESILKTLAITGLLGITILIAWLAVQIVQIFPAALSSLVGMANSVYNYNPLETRELTLTEHETTVNAGESFTVSWERPNASGTYVFSFDCASDTTLSLNAENKEFADLSCNEQYDLGPVDTISLTAHTKTNQLSDLTYTISFYRPNSQTPAASRSATVTVVDASIALTPSEPTPITDNQVTPIVEELPAVVETPLVQTPSEPEPVPVTTPPAPSAISTPVFTYAIPVSNPLGSADLVVSFLGTGYTTANGTFVLTNTLLSGKPGAFQFAVHNIGDKTSQRWSYEVGLPNQTTYESDSEDPLRPNERAVFTISFPALDSTATVATISLIIDTDEDRNRNTNVIEQTIPVTK